MTGQIGEALCFFGHCIKSESIFATVRVWMQGANRLHSNSELDHTFLKFPGELDGDCSPNMYSFLHTVLQGHHRYLSRCSTISIHLILLKLTGSSCMTSRLTLPVETLHSLKFLYVDFGVAKHFNSLTKTEVNNSKAERPLGRSINLLLTTYSVDVGQPDAD